MKPARNRFRGPLLQRQWIDEKNRRGDVGFQSLRLDGDEAAEVRKGAQDLRLIDNLESKNNLTHQHH